MTEQLDRLFNNGNSNMPDKTYKGELKIVKQDVIASAKELFQKNPPLASGIDFSLRTTIRNEDEFLETGVRFREIKPDDPTKPVTYGFFNIERSLRKLDAPFIENGKIEDDKAWGEHGKALSETIDRTLEKIKKA